MAGKYAVGNSRSPMMFSKFRKGKKRGEKEQKLSRSLDDLLGRINEGCESHEIASDVEWPEVASVKKVSPVVMCILPPFSMDFVCSALLSVGATPLITDNVLDVVKDLRNSRAVVVDVSAPPDLITALMESFDPTMDTCLVLAATQVGSNDRKKDLAVELIERCGPSLVTGRLADIYTLGQVAAERDTTDGDSDTESDMKPQISVEGSPDLSRKASAPDGERKASPDPSRKVSAPAAVRSRIHHGIKAKLSAMSSMGEGELSPHISPHVSPRTSPRTSPRGSPQSSPRNSLGSSPVPGGVKNRWKVGRVIQRVHTYHPRVKMRGQFQDSSMMEVNVDDALLYGQKLAAHTRASIYLFETSILTDGETDIEIQNSQLGIRDLHSLLPCSAAIAAACVSSVQAETEDTEEVQFHQFSHAMALWCAAVEEAGNHANQKGHILPGAMRQALIDALHYLNEPQVRTMARLFKHCTGSSTPSDDK